MLAGARDDLIGLRDTDAKPPTTRLLGRVIFYGLIVLMGLAAIPYGTVEPWAEALFECAVFALCLCFAIEGYLSGSWYIPGLSLFYPVIALIVFALLQSVAFWQISLPAAAGGKVWVALSADPYESRRFALKLAALALAAALLLRYLVTRRRLLTLINVVIGISVVSAMFGLLRQTVQQQQKGFVLPLLLLDSGYGQFINRNHFAYLMEMALGLGLGLIAARGVRRDRILMYLAALLLVWTALVLSNSRGGMLAMLVQVVLALMLFIRTRTQKETSAVKSARPGGIWRLARSLVVQIALVAGLILAIIFGVIWIGGDPVVSHIETASIELETRNSEAFDGGRRRDIWRDSWEMFKSSKILGVGLGGYWTAIPQYHEGSGQLTPQRAHNDYLELLASGGIIGAAIGLWFGFILMRRIRDSLRSKDSFYRACACGATIAIVGVAVHSLFDFGLHITSNALIFVSLLAVLGVGERFSGQVETL